MAFVPLRSYGSRDIFRRLVLRSTLPPNKPLQIIRSAPSVLAALVGEQRAHTRGWMLGQSRSYLNFLVSHRFDIHAFHSKKRFSVDWAYKHIEVVLVTSDAPLSLVLAEFAVSYDHTRPLANPALLRIRASLYGQRHHHHFAAPSGTVAVIRHQFFFAFWTRSHIRYFPLRSTSAAGTDRRAWSLSR
jgi:hypothetical protein